MSFNSFNEVAYLIKSYAANKKWFRCFTHRSSVALILRENNQALEVLMIKRAEREGDPWSGQMGFPGGRAEKVDKNTLCTARRETYEEIGLDASACTQHIGRLSDILARPRRWPKAMVVTPYIFTIEQVPALRLNGEVDEVVWIPLAFFFNKDNRKEKLFTRGSLQRLLPYYEYQGKTVWGMSLMMLDELMTLIQR